LRETHAYKQRVKESLTSFLGRFNGISGCSHDICALSFKGGA
jgi:hypothetical protein